MTTVRIIPEIDGNGGVHLTLFLDGATDKVGPLQEGQELLAVLDAPVATGGRSAPTKRIKKLSDRQERRVASDIGGRGQPGSGNQPGAKGDVRVQGKHRVEAKYTFAQSYSIQLEELRKILSEATAGEAAALQVDFRNKTTGHVTDSWVLMPYEDWVKKVAADAPGDDQRSPRRRPR